MPGSSHVDKTVSGLTGGEPVPYQPGQAAEVPRRGGAGEGAGGSLAHADPPCLQHQPHSQENRIQREGPSDSRPAKGVGVSEWPSLSPLPSALESTASTQMCTRREPARRGPPGPPLPSVFLQTWPPHGLRPGGLCSWGPSPTRPHLALCSPSCCFPQSMHHLLAHLANFHFLCCPSPTLGIWTQLWAPRPPEGGPLWRGT